MKMKINIDLVECIITTGYYKWSLIKNNVSCVKFSTHKETKTW